MRDRAFFFHRQLGYRQNPFGALTAEEWTAVAVMPPAVQQACDAGFTHLQLLGPKGCGKTTTLLKLAAARQAQGEVVAYEYLPEGQRHFKTQPADGSVFVLDEAQRLRRGERIRWLNGNTAVRFIFSSHIDLTPLFDRFRLPLVTVWLDAGISAAHYQRCIEKRLAYFALPGQRLELADTAMTALYQHFGPDMREAEYFLYEVFQYPWPQPKEEGKWLLTAVHFASWGTFSFGGH
jgi:hypothetical protein